MLLLGSLSKSATTSADILASFCDCSEPEPIFGLIVRLREDVYPDRSLNTYLELVDFDGDLDHLRSQSQY